MGMRFLFVIGILILDRRVELQRACMLVLILLVMVTFCPPPVFGQVVRHCKLRKRSSRCVVPLVWSDPLDS